MKKQADPRVASHESKVIKRLRADAAIAAAYLKLAMEDEAEPCACC